MADRRKRWSILLTIIQSYTIYYSTEKAAVKRELKNSILNRLKRYDGSLEESFTEYTKYDINILQKQLFALELQEIQGYIIRTRIANFERKEPSIKLYSDLERKKSQKDLISSLKDENGDEKSEK